MPKAAGLADSIKEKYGIDTELIKGSGGVFDVALNDHLIFSKDSLGRFPESGEVEDLVAAKLA